MYKVYSLADPRDGKVRYIGCTRRKTLGLRLGNHLREALNPRSLYYEVKRNRWIREVHEAGHRPLIALIAEFPTQESGWAAEKFFIASLRGQLVNETSGGPGVPNPSEDVRRRKSESASRKQKEAWARDDGSRRTLMRDVALRNPQNTRKAIAASAAARTGKPLPPDWKANVVNAQRRPEVQAKRIAALTGQKRSPEARARMSEAQLRRREQERQQKSGG